jgi:hypothetical protein
MDRPSAIPSRFGFYILLLFSFSVSVFPELARILAAVALCVWLFQVLVFRGPAPLQSTLFYPICGLFSFSILSLLISWLFSSENPLACVGLYSAFYFVANSFIQSQEKRKMVMWTFLSGVILSLSVHILSRLDKSSDPAMPEHLPVLAVMAFCLILSFYAEARGIQEKTFFGFIFLPVAIGMLGADIAVAMTIFLLLLIIGVVKDRAIFALIALMLIVIFSGFLDIKQDLKSAFSRQGVEELINTPLRSIDENRNLLTESRFYGLLSSEPEISESTDNTVPFFISLIGYSGPPSLLLLLWVVFELGRRGLAKVRKIASREEKAYHLAALLIIIILMIVNIQGSWLACSPAILGFWVIMGMAEI